LKDHGLIGEALGEFVWALARFVFPVPIPAAVFAIFPFAA
jgi:hypothetical protein